MARSLNIFVPHCSDVLTDHLPHGDGLIAYGFMTSLARRGHRLHVAAERVELRDPVHPNITIYPIVLKRAHGLKPRLQYMLRVRRLMRELMRSQQFDLIHQMNPVFTGMSLALLGSGLPLVLGTYVARWPDDPHALTSTTPWGKIVAASRDLIAKVQQRQADALVLTTPAAWNRLPDPEAVQDRIHLIPHGLDTDLFSPKAGWDSEETLQNEQQQPTILFLANVVRRKGILTLIEAFPAILHEFKNCRLRIAGDGFAMEEAKQRIATLGYLDRVEFLGFQERVNTPELYRNCSVYCLPSFGEPYGTTVVEAMSCARALVVTDCGALPHLVHEAGGMRVPVKDPKALSQALITLLRNPQQRMEMGKYNRQLAETKMSWESVAQQLEAIYEIVLSRRAQSLNRNLAPRAFKLNVGSGAQEPASEL